MTTYSIDKVLREFDVVSDLFALWVILKAGNICGKIITRYSKSTLTARTALILFDTTSADGLPLYGFERLTGYGFDKTRAAIANILTANRERLNSAFGVQLSDPDWNIINTWERDFKASGFDVIRVL